MVDNCKHVNKITPSPTHSILNPQKWLCCECGTTESVWACLSCSHVACGRYIEEHAVKHYKETKHPLSLEVNEKYAYCYECGDYILNDNRAGDLKILRNALSAVALQSFEGLEKRGKRILRSQSYSSSDKGFQRRLREQDRNTTILWFRRYYIMAKAFSAWKLGTPSIQKQQEEEKARLQKEQEREEAKRLRLAKNKQESQVSCSSATSVKQKGKRKGPFIPGVTGLRNLGNTCYMNSVLQVLSHLREFRSIFLQTCENEVENTPQQSPKSSSSQTRPSNSSSALSSSNGLDAVANSRKSPRRHNFGRQTTMECFQHISENGSGKKRAGLNGGSSASPSKKLKLAGTAADIEKNKVSLCGELHALLRVMWSGKWALVSPDKMLSAVWQTIPFFKGYSQQDAQEFLCEFLDKLSSELDTDVSSSKSLSSSLLSNPTTTTSTAGSSSSTNQSNNPVPSLSSVSVSSSLSASNSHLRSSISDSGKFTPESLGKQMKDIVTNMFHGELVSEVTCKKCGKKSLTKESFTDLSLEFPDRYHYRGPGQKISYENCHVEEMLAKFTEKEKLDGNIYACEQCNKHRRRSVAAKPTIYTQVEKQFMVQTLPHVLRLHLKRFMWSGRNHRGKIAIHVDFCTELDMKPYCHPSIQAASFQYQLNAIVMHHGRGFGSGHYTAYCMNEDADSWIHCNDAKLQKISVEEVMKAQAYILFYTQKPAPSTQVLPLTINPVLELSTKQLPLFDEEADEEITFNFHNSTIPRFVELKRRLSEDHTGRMALKKRKSNMW